MSSQTAHWKPQINTWKWKFEGIEKNDEVRSAGEGEWHWCHKTIIF